MSTIIPLTSTDNGPIWRNALNSNFKALNDDLVQAEADIVIMQNTSQNASTTAKGVVKTSVSPASPTSPIVVGDNDTRIPTQGENDAMSGTTGTPSSSNKYVTSTDTDFNNNMKVTGNQSIDGIKTFGSIPVLSGTPTNPNDFVNKAYMDALFANN